MRKLTSVIEKTKDIARKIAGHAEQTRVSIRAKLAEAQEEAKRQNEKRKPVQKKKDLSGMNCTSILNLPTALFSILSVLVSALTLLIRRNTY